MADDEDIRVGIGYDVHRLAKGRRLILGGVEINYPFGLAGHSDADVALHAVIDAMFGAAAVGDIGQHFPPGDPQYKDISSLVLLERANQVILQQGWHIGNIDVTIVADEPRLLPHIAAMRKKIADALKLAIEQVSVKSKTSEGLGFIGRGEGIAAYALATLKRN